MRLVKSSHNHYGSKADGLDRICLTDFVVFIDAL